MAKTLKKELATLNFNLSSDKSGKSWSKVETEF